MAGCALFSGRARGGAEAVCNRSSADAATPIITARHRQRPRGAGAGLNSGCNVLGQGWRSSDDRPRAPLVLNNIGGASLEGDKAAHGQPRSPSPSPKTRRSPWQPFHVDDLRRRGTVSVIGVTGTRHIYRAGARQKWWAIVGRCRRGLQESHWRRATVHPGAHGGAGRARNACQEARNSYSKGRNSLRLFHPRPWRYHERERPRLFPRWAR
jgi:hypothetical protein